MSIATSNIEEINLSQWKKWRRVFVLLLLLLIVAFLINVSLGSVSIPLLGTIRIIMHLPSDNPIWDTIFWQFRLPKAIAAIIVGMALSASGLQMQTLFKNPLAGPFVLGISSGASLGVALVVMASYSFGGIIGALGSFGSGIIAIAATLGAFFVLLLVVAASSKIKDSMTLLIVGLMFGSATGAAVSILQYFSDARDIQAFLIWTFGSLGGITDDEMIVFIPTVAAGLAIAFVLSKPLNALLLGENYASSMGVNVRKTRLWIIISASLLAGGVTAFCGPIAFIGIAVPHLTRLLFNTSNHKLLLPLVCITGAIVMLLSDSIAQLPGSQHTLPINAITSLFGAPVIIWIIMRKKNLKTHFT
jgi:iron complex transport system permease protein